MSRDFFGNKWVLGGIVFLIVFSVACVFWYRYDTAPYRKSAAKTDEIIRKWDATQKVRTDNVRKTNTDTIIKGSMQTSEKPKTENNDDAIVDFTSPSNTNSNLTKQNQDVEKGKEVRVSPHGFGPYPEIPDGYRAPNIFNKPLSRDQELMMRVDVKLWKQGIRTAGIGIDYKSGLVYPTIKGTIYVTWGDHRLPDGSIIRVADNLSGHPVTIDSLPQSGLPGIPNCPEIFLLENEIPAHITVLEHSEGIEPYEFLKEELK